MPLWPCRRNLNLLAMTLAEGLMNASFRSLVMDSGRAVPWCFSNSGFGSKSSYWLGPPSMNMKMTCFALPGK